MKKQGVVSLWLGSFKNIESLNKFINENYNDQGDVYSLFNEKTGFEHLDNQFQEVDFYQNKTDKNRIFEGFSYVESFINDIPDSNWSDFDSVILIYNFEYKKKPKNESSLKFLGVFNYLND